MTITSVDVTQSHRCYDARNIAVSEAISQKAAFLCLPEATNCNILSVSYPKM